MGDTRAESSSLFVNIGKQQEKQEQEQEQEEEEGAIGPKQVKSHFFT